MTGPTVIANFEADFDARLRQELTGMGLTPPTGGTLEELSRVFWNARRRHVERRPRKVHFASEFERPMNPETEKGIAALVTKFEAGEDVTPHLSKGAKDAQHPAFDDKLLNDWNIHHFHLGAVPSQGALADRTSLLVFATVRPDDVYIIDVLDHHNWSRQDLMERVHRNWPFLLKKVQGMRPSTHRLTDDNVKTLRRKNAQAFFQSSDGTQYFPPGGGQVSAGISIEVVQLTDWSLNTVRAWDKWVKENAESLAADIVRAGKQVPEPMRLKLEVDFASLHINALEETARVRLMLGPLFPR